MLVISLFYLVLLCPFFSALLLFLYVVCVLVLNLQEAIRLLDQQVNKTGQN
jgi:NADH:ubiquinone oxidoreductase subunit 6 (subunit J)